MRIFLFVSWQAGECSRFQSNDRNIMKEVRKRNGHSGFVSDSNENVMSAIFFQYPFCDVDRSVHRFIKTWSESCKQYSRSLCRFQWNIRNKLYVFRTWTMPYKAEGRITRISAECAAKHVARFDFKKACLPHLWKTHWNVDCRGIVVETKPYQLRDNKVCRTCDNIAHCNPFRLIL